jgi:hypothetical protein
MPRGTELLGEVPGKSPAMTTRDQLLLGAHAVNNHSITVCGCSPRLDGRPTWGRTVDTITLYSLFTPRPPPPLTINGGGGRGQ